jgi:cell division protease FtsH
MGGYATEKTIFDELTTGASNDLKVATNLARQLVTRYGMSDLGPMTFGESHDMIFLGREISEQKNYSEKIAARIDEEIASFIDQGHKTALEVIKKYHKELKAIAEKLIEVETIEREEFEKLVVDVIPKEKMLKPGQADLPSNLPSPAVA